MSSFFQWRKKSLVLLLILYVTIARGDETTKNHNFEELYTDTFDENVTTTDYNPKTSSKGECV